MLRQDPTVYRSDNDRIIPPMYVIPTDFASELIVTLKSEAIQEKMRPLFQSHGIIMSMALKEAVKMRKINKYLGVLI